MVKNSRTRVLRVDCNSVLAKKLAECSLKPVTTSAAVLKLGDGDEEEGKEDRKAWGRGVFIPFTRRC